MTANLSAKRVMVIGGETPLGRALAVGLAELGADVAIASLSKETKAEFAINSALNELWALGRNGVALAIDASNAQELVDALARAESDLGPLDLVVAVAGGDGVAAAPSGRKVVALAENATIDVALATVAAAL